MRKLRFLVPPGSLAAGEGAIVALPEEEARHLAVTLRGEPGLGVSLFDGKGVEWNGEVVDAGRGRAHVRLLEAETSPVESPLRVTVYQSLSLDRVFEESIEPLTALGVAALVPLLAERSRGAGRAPDAKRLARWRRIACEACKLSFRRVVPEIGEPVAVDAVGTDASAGVLSVLLDPGAPPGALRALLAGPAPSSLRLAIGPEGGFTPGEVAALGRAGFLGVRLGPRVLRTQHAGSAAISVMLASWSDVG